MVRRTVIWAALLQSGWTLAALFLDVTGHRAPPAGPVDAVVVAGCSVDPGGLPSDCLAVRVDRGIALYKAHQAPVLIFTGGEGSYPPSEAEVAAQRARAAGVPDASILIESRSTSTEENACFAAALSTAQSVVVVSDAWHTHRVARVFARYFPQVATVGVDTPWLDRGYGAHREVVALVWYAVLGRLSSESTDER